MRCGHCKGEHATVDEVRSCSRADHPSDRQAAPLPATLPSGERVATVKDALLLLAAFRPDADADLLRAWAADPATASLVGFRTRLLADHAAALAAQGLEVTPAALFARARSSEQSAARDAGSVLEGRNERFTSGKRADAPGSSDRAAHQRIGPTQTGS